MPQIVPGKFYTVQQARYAVVDMNMIVLMRL
jgi:hypothetical protein